MRSRVIVLPLLLGVLLATAYAGSAAAEHRMRSALGSDPMTPGQVYRGDFPDPAILHARGQYFAYATMTAGMNLPVLTAPGLSLAWRAKQLTPGYSTADALPDVPAWAWSRNVDGRRVGVTWAPSVAKVAGRFVAAYATRVGGTKAKMCISVATATSPGGPFQDRSTGPLVCPSNRGAIDPQLRVVGGQAWLLYKTEDISIHRPTRLWIRRLSAGATRLATTGDDRPHLLLTAAGGWENHVIENPSMIGFHGHRYLFYSGNGWGSRHYGIGYAECASLLGPCTRVVSGPLLASGGGIVGPGGEFAIIGPNGGLRLAYHAWDQGRVGYPTSTKCLQTALGCGQRRMHVASLYADRRGHLHVGNLGLAN